MLGIAFRVSPPTLKLLIHKQNLAYASSWRKLCIEVLGLGTRYDEDLGFTAEKNFWGENYRNFKYRYIGMKSGNPD